jgi:hypothetical protein
VACSLTSLEMDATRLFKETHTHIHTHTNTHTRPHAQVPVYTASYSRDRKYSLARQEPQNNVASVILTIRVTEKITGIYNGACNGNSRQSNLKVFHNFTSPGLLLC